MFQTKPSFGWKGKVQSEVISDKLPKYQDYKRTENKSIECLFNNKTKLTNEIRQVMFPVEMLP